MFRSYFLMAFRDIRRNALYASIKVFGLAVGMACAILIMLFIRDELSYDRYHENADRIFRLTMTRDLEGRQFRSIMSSGDTGPQLVAEYPEVLDAVRVDMHRWFVVEHGETRTTTDPVYADPSLLTTFSFPMLRGDRKTALADPTSVVITESLARRLFGRADPVGQTIAIYGLSAKYDLKITGLLKDIPANSHFRFDFVSSLEHLRSRSDEKNGRLVCVTYLLLRDKRDAAALEAKLPDFIKRHYGERAAGRTFHLQPLTSIHLGSHLELELEENSSLSVSYTLSLIAVVILLVAGINFVNLSVARASRRGREVGMRKVVGASKPQLVGQFMSEAVLLALISLLLAVLIAFLLLPSFNSLVGKHLGLGVGANPVFYAVLILLSLVVGLLAGAYPAFVLSAYRPAVVLKGETRKGGSSGALVRKGLVVVQFSVALVFIIGTLVVSRQLRYVKNKDLGVKNENVIDLPIFKDHELTKRVDLIERELGSVPGVADITVSTGEVGFYNGWPVQCVPEGHAPDSTVGMNVLMTGNNFFKFFGVGIVQGRDFEKDIASDATSSVIINETAAKALGWQTPVGKRISSTHFSDDREKSGVRTVIGVVRDFHNGSLHEKIMPSIYQFLPEQNNDVFVRLRPSQIPETLAALERKWKDLPTHIPFAYNFLDNPLESGMYSQDRKLGRIFGFSSSLALFLAAVGIFGLMSFAAERRRREIGIRKVMGANRTQIVSLLVKDFSALVAIANVLAWPVGFCLSRRWLQSFAYRAGIVWWIFVVSGFSVLAITVLTVGFQAVKAAGSDPVKTLRYE
jgi:putative ABC transport system permease protein